MATKAGRHNTARAIRSAAATAVTPEALLDLVERLGLVDLVVDRIRARLAEVDIDEVLDEIGDYMRRNPEAIVVALGTITIAAGALVYLTRDEEYRSVRRGVDREMEIPRVREREREAPSRPRAASSATASRRRASPSE
jgi:hypothetical protein